MRVIKKLCLILLAAIVSLTSVASVLNHSVTAKKGDPFYSTQSIDNEALKRLRLNTLATCLRDKSDEVYSDEILVKTEGTNTDIFADVNIRGDNIKAASGWIGDNNDDMTCSHYTIATARGVLNQGGWQGVSLRSIFCNMGAPITPNRNQCGSSSSGDLTVNLGQVKNVIVTKFSLASYAYYYGAQSLYDKNNNSCGGYTDMGVLGTDIQEGDKTGDDYTFYLINGEDGSGESHVYRLKDKDHKVHPFNTTSGSYVTSGIEISCKAMIKSHMSSENSDWVQAYKAFLKSKQKPKPSTSGSGSYEDCKKKYPMQQKACQVGAQHKGDGKYCETRYSARGEKYVEACKYAAGVLSGTDPSSSSGSGATSTEDPVTDPLGGSTGGNGANEEDQENCKIDYIGWIVCPIVNTLASMSEGARAKLVDMLTINAKSILGDTSEGSVYSYWSKIRDYANILFVVFFLFVIYSQMTGYGLDNYGIKRMLPKLIVGVIVVNASFYICGLLVDLSNVVGSSAFNFVSTAAVGDIPAGEWSNSDSGWINKIAGLALVLTVGYFALATVISMLLFVVITAVTTIFLLGVREAIIILCIVLSPLAFVAMIMPNTEGLYKKWWSAFKASLMVYPMVGLVFGASNLAARILGSGLDEKDIIMQSIVALLVFAPLLIVPKLVRSAVEIIGIGGAIAWANKKMNKGRDRLTDKVGKWRENKLTSQFGKHRREKAQLRNAQIRGGTYRGRGGFVNPRNWRSGANRRLNAMSGDFGQKRKLAGSAAALAEDNERMKAANAWIADNNMSSDRLAEIATGFTRDKDSKKVAADLSGISSYQRRAAMQALAPHMTSKQASDLAEASASFGDASLQKEAANAIAESGAKKAPWLGGKQLEAIKQGTYNEEEAMGDYIKNKSSGSGLANADADAVRRMVKFSADQVRQNADSSYMRSLINARADLEADPKTAGTVPASVRAEINKIPPLRQQQTHGASNSQGTGGSQGSGGSSSGNPSPKGSTPPPNPGSGSGGQGPQNSTPPPKPSNTPDTPKPNSSSDPGSDSGSSNPSDSSSSDSSGGDTTTHNGQTFTQTSSGLYIPKH